MLYLQIKEETPAEIRNTDETFAAELQGLANIVPVHFYMARRIGECDGVSVCSHAQYQETGTTKRLAARESRKPAFFADK